MSNVMFTTVDLDFRFDVYFCFRKEKTPRPRESIDRGSSRDRNSGSGQNRLEAFVRAIDQINQTATWSNGLDVVVVGLPLLFLGMEVWREQQSRFTPST